MPVIAADPLPQETISSAIDLDVGSPNPKAEPAKEWTRRDWRIFELVLVCAMAFGTSILSSGERFFTGNYTSSSYHGEMSWIYPLLRQTMCLALLWYVLRRRATNFAGLGLRWSLKEVLFGFLFFLAAIAIYVVCRGLIMAVLTGLGMAQNPHPNVSKMLFGGRVAIAAVLFQFVNPFFEELIVRAFLMTELKALTNSATVAVVGSVLFQTSYHFYQGAPAAISHIPTFLLFSLYYAKTNRIGAPIVAHLLWDLFSTFDYMFRLGQHHF